jgi:hypothetical protein
LAATEATTDAEEGTPSVCKLRRHDRRADGCGPSIAFYLPAHVQVIETGGTVLADSGTMSLFLSQIYTASYVYCRFVNANTRKVKADLTLFNAFSGDFSDTTVVPAQ